MRKTTILALAPLLIGALPAHACVSEVPAFSVQDMSMFLFGGASVGSLMLLGYMHLPVAAKAKIRSLMAVTVMVLVGVFAIAATFVYAGPMVTSWVTQPTPNATTRPVQPPVVHPTTTPPLMVRF